MKNRISRIFNNDFIISLIVKLFVIVTGLLSTIFLNRYLGVELKGEYAYYVNIVNLLVVVLNFGFSNIYSYAKRSKIENVKDKFYNISYIEFFAIVLFALILFFVFKFKISIFILILIATTNLFNQLNVYILIDNIKYRQKINIIISLINMFLCFLVFLILTRNVEIGYFLLIIKDVIGIALILLKEKIKFNISILDKQIIKFWVKYGIFAMLAALLLTLNYKVDTIFIGNILTNVDTGIYSVAIAFAEYGWVIADSFKEVIQHKTSINDSIDDVNFAISVNLIIIFVYILFFSIFGNFIINIMYGSEYLPSVPITNVLLIGCISMIIFKLTAPVYLANGKQFFYLIVLAASAIINIVLNALLIPKFQLYGASIASIASYSTCGIVFYLKYIKDYKLKWFEPIIGIRKINFFLKERK